MGINFTKRAKIVWGVNTLLIKYPLDDWRTGSTSRDGSQFIQIESGEEESWIVGTDYYLEGSVRWIPTTSSGAQTGWDGSTGWRAFLEYARTKQTFKWYSDKDSASFITSYLVEPMDGSHTLEPDSTRSLKIRIRNGTTPYDGY